MDFNVKYFDGASSAAKDAIVHFTSDHWHIRYIDEFSTEHKLDWDINQISRIASHKGNHTFRYGKFPQQTIETESKDFLEELAWQFPGKLFSQQAKKILTVAGSFNLLLGVFLLFIFFVAGIYFFVLPWASQEAVKNVPLEYEERMGEFIYKQFVTEYSRKDSLSQLLDSFAQTIDFETNYNIKVTVVKSMDMNAFAMPGGRIVIFDKMLDSINSPEQLSALLAHEVSHIKYRHSLQLLSKNLAGYLFISFMFGDLNGVASVLIDNVDMLNNLNYSRKLERMADFSAFEILKINKIDQHGMLELFELLKSAEDFKATKILSTHPVIDERIAYTKLELKTQKVTLVNHDRQMIWNRINQLKNSN